MPENRDDLWLIEAIQHVEQGVLAMKRVQADPESRLDKRALAIAITHAETAQFIARKLQTGLTAR